MFKEHYTQMNDVIVPSPELIRLVLQPKRRRHVGRTWVLAIAAVFLVSICGIPVLAATVPQFQQMLYAAAPQLAQWMTPVQQSCESSGIRMTVQSARVEGSEAFVYLSLQDLTGDRIDGTIDLFDSYTLQGIGNFDASCTWVGYEEEKALFLVHLQGEQQIKGKVTFSFDSFLSGVEEHRVSLPLNHIERTLNMDTVQYNGLSGSYEPHLAGEQADRIKILRPGSGANLAGNIDLSGLAYHDGRLHVQTAEENGWENDSRIQYFLQVDGQVQEELYGVGTNLAFVSGKPLSERVVIGRNPDGTTVISLVDDDGNQVIPEGDLSVKRINESVFTLTEEELQRATMTVEMRTSKEVVLGNWHVTFDLNSLSGHVAS